MIRPLALTLLPAALAACFALTGCTIYTYDQPPPNTTRRPAKTRPAGKTTQGGIVKRPASGGGATRTPGDVPATDAPTVQGKTIFGGGAVQPFVGDAFVIPEGTRAMPNFDDLVPFARLYTDQFNVSPQTFTGGFPGALLQDEWFAIRYAGKILVPTAGTWTFKLVSDDGAILYIDGKKVVDNDGIHTARTATGNADLSAGQHTLVLEYFQEKKGTVALQLFTLVGGRDVPVVGVN